VEKLLVLLDDTVGLGGYTEWNTSISAAMVMMAFVIFLFVWIVSPRSGLVSTVLRRWSQRGRFAQQMLLGHIYHHQGTDVAAQELAVPTLHQHLKWTPYHLQSVLNQLRARRLVRVENQLVMLTAQGERSVTQFMHENLVMRESG
jgi:manganese/zinc/iron transport system permease protein